MGISHLLTISSYLKYSSEPVSRYDIKRKFGINQDLINECLAYLIQTKQVKELDLDRYKKYIWVRK